MKNILRIIRISKPLHHIVFGLAILILAGALLAMATPLLSKFIVDEIVLQLQHKSGNINKLVLLIIAAFAANLVQLITTVASERLGDHFAGRIRKFLTEVFYDKIFRLPQSYYDSEVSGKIVNQLNRGIITIYTFLNTATNFILPTFIQSILIILILGYYNLPIGLFLFCLFPIYLLISYYSTIQWGKEEVKKNSIEDVTHGRIQEVIANMSLVKGFGQEKQEYKTVESNLSKINAIYAKQSRTFHIFDFFRGLSLNITLFGINLVVFYNAFNGTLTLGEMVLILQFVNQARLPLFAMSFILTQIQMAESGSKEYFEILDLQATEDYTKKIQLKKLENPTIRFSNVHFHYEKSNTVLKDVSFSLRKNEKVALVGHSGAGKSTIVNLILKFYEPTRGDIFINVNNYKSLEHGLIRNNIALVFQENELFSSTIYENVAYGKQDSTEKDVINALRLANAWEFVKKLPNGMQSQVGERGVRLSGGQKQRIQIARAILKDAPILILDEATSSLDAKSEKDVQEALENLMKNKLVIIIAHRFSTIQNVDTILVVEKGTITASGTPKELSTKPGVYSELLHYQIAGNKKLLESFDIY